MASKRKRRGEPADPDFVAHVERVAAAHREAFLATRQAQRALPDPGDLAPVAPSTLHSHDAGCWAVPPRWEYRRNSSVIEVGRICQRFDQWVPDHHANAIELSALTDAEKKRLNIGTGLYL